MNTKEKKKESDFEKKEYLSNSGSHGDMSVTQRGNRTTQSEIGEFLGKGSEDFLNIDFFKLYSPGLDQT